MRINEVTDSAQAFIQIPPQEYLALALPFGANSGPEMNPDKVNNLAQLQHWNTTPMFSVKQNNDGQFQVGLHDGRHRALVAAQRGQPLTVQVVRGRKFARENPTLSDLDLLHMVIKAGTIISEDGSRVIPTTGWQIR